MEKNENHGLIKTILEIGPVIIFFVTFIRIKDQEFEYLGQTYEGFMVATAIFIPLMVLATGAVWYLTGKLSRMQVTTTVLVIIFGGLSIWFNDDRFFKMKPTILYVLFGGILAFGLMRSKSYLEYVMGEMMPMEPEGWVKLTRRLVLLFACLAIANEIVWRSTSDLVWVNFKTFGLPGALFVFFLAQAPLLAKYGIEEEEEEA